MQEQTGALGAGGAVDMEENHAQEQQCVGAGRVQGIAQVVSKAGAPAQTTLGLAR